MGDLKVAENEGAVKFGVKVVPAGSRTELTGLYNGMLKIKVSAVPEKGKANRALIAFLAKQLGVKKKQVGIIGGRTNAVKEIQVSGISADTLLEKFGLNG